MDQRLRAINADLSLRVVAATATLATREAGQRQPTFPSERVLLGRVLAAAATMATLAKGDNERLRIQMVGRGPVQQVLADAYGDGRVRACVKVPLARLPASTAQLLGPVDHAPDHPPRIGALLGARGSLTVVRDLGLASPYEGTCELRSGEIDDDLEHYLNHSEQLPSVLACETILDDRGEVVRCAGLLIQSFPGAQASEISGVRERLHDRALAVVLQQERSLEDLIAFALGGDAFSLMDRQSVRFSCPCGPQRALSVLSTLGAQDLEALAQEQSITQITCSFCGKVEEISAADVLALAQSLRGHRS